METLIKTLADAKSTADAQRMVRKGKMQGGY